MIYRNDPKFTDRQAGANSVDPDQTAPPKYSDTRKIAVIILKFEQCDSTIA